jgi:hypothetical protein
MGQIIAWPRSVLFNINLLPYIWRIATDKCGQPPRGIPETQINWIEDNKICDNG